MNKIVKNIFVSFFLSLVLLVIGLMVRYLIFGQKTALQDILFWVGAIPIAFFTIGIFGDYPGNVTPSYQHSRTVSDESSNQRCSRDARDLLFRGQKGLNWIMAGLLIWFYSAFM